MKIFFIVLTLLLSSHSFSQQTWIDQTSGVTTELKDIKCVTESVAWAVGVSGVILKTVDGGETWKKQTSGTMQVLTSVDATDTLNAWAVSTEAAILRTTDGGETWLKVTTPVSIVQGEVDMVNSRIGYACSYTANSRAMVLKTTDGGAKWDSLGQSLVGISGMRAISAPDSANAWAGGLSGIIHTSDGGANWNYISGGSALFPAGVSSLFFFNAQIGYAGAIYQQFAATTNGGTLWIPQIIGTPNPFPVSEFYAISFVSATLGMVATPNFIYMTSTGGAVWDAGTKPFTSTTDAVSSVDFLNPNRAWAVGTGGKIGRYGDGTATPVALSSFDLAQTSACVVATWSTASEENNLGFELWRDGGSGFEKISDYSSNASLRGAGTTSLAQTYSFLDRTVATNRRYSYKLVQVNTDGSREELGTRSITLRISEKINSLFTVRGTYPNPANDVTELSVDSRIAAPAMLHILDMLGREVAGNAVTLTAGSNSIPLDVATLRNGIYTYQLIAARGAVSGQLIVQHN